jgi:uncharacterized protein (TIGR02145 family)
MNSLFKRLVTIVVLLISTDKIIAQDIDKRCKIIHKELLLKDSLLKSVNFKLDSVLNINYNLNIQKQLIVDSLALIRRENNFIKIGNQKWDSDNLKVRTLKDGNPIFFADTREKWDSLFQIGEPAYCLHKNDSLGLFGYIYNYYAVSSGKLAPEGMRIPTKEDVNELIRFNQLINGKGAILLKSNDSISNHFPVWKKRGLDIFQMGIRPLGFRLDDSKEWYFGNKIYYWCQITDPKKINLMAITEINDDPFILEKTIEEKNSNYGLYVRCIK